MMTRCVAFAFGLSWLLYGSFAANACPGSSGAIGTSRVISIDPAEHARLGTMQYAETLPLADKEVVLTFDDGPLPRNTTRVLDILASECVKATFFLVGSMARAYPDVVRRIHAEGHTLGTHSQNHPKIFNRMPITRIRAEVEEGISSVAAALDNPGFVAPFFRIPGLARSPLVENYLQERKFTTWSADFLADDWKRIDANEILRRALQRIEAKGKGILLLHDIKPATVLALPLLLEELKIRGYRIVHVVPAGIDQPETVTAPQDWIPTRTKEASPSVVSASAKPQVHVPRAMAAAPTEPESPPNAIALRRTYPSIATIKKCQRFSEWQQLFDGTLDLQYCQN